MSTLVNEEEKSDLEKQLEEIDNQFNIKLDEIKVDLPEGLNLDPIEYNGKSDEEIKADAESQLAAYYNDGKNNINQGTEDSKKELESNKITAQKAKDEKSGYIQSVYETAKESASNDVLKRGLARSTVATNTINGYEEKKADEILKVTNDYTDAIKNLDEQILSLETKKEAALRDFDITYAAKLAIKISDLTTERDEKTAEATKYNNSLKEKESDYSIERLKTISELTGESLDNLKKKVELYTESAAKLDQAKIEAKYEVLLNNLNSMSRKAALSELENNPVYKASLSDEYYEKLRLTTIIRKS